MNLGTQDEISEMMPCWHFGRVNYFFSLGTVLSDSEVRNGIVWPKRRIGMQMASLLKAFLGK